MQFFVYLENTHLSINGYTLINTKLYQNNTTNNNIALCRQSAILEAIADYSLLFLHNIFIHCECTSSVCTLVVFYQCITMP